MANPEHLEILKQGVSAWNEWKHDAVRSRNAILGRQRDLSSLDFNKIEGEYFLFDRIEAADLAGIDLSDDDLKDANLESVNLSHANLNNADLRGANLLGANLAEATFISANLTNANLANVFLFWTVFANANLTGAKGLESCYHYDRSIIDFNTLAKSGNLPLSFLRGCGLPDTFIEYIPSLLNDPIQFYSCFISYSSKDQDFAERLYADLQNKGVRCWFAPEDIKIGDKFRSRIDESIRIYDKLLLVLSEHSVSSQWVEKEVETAMEREREQNKTMLFPIRLDDTVNEIKIGWPADIRRARHIGDFTRWKNHDSYQKAFDRLLCDLKAEEK